MDEEGQLDVQEMYSQRGETEVVCACTSAGGTVNLWVELMLGPGRPRRRFMDGVSEDRKLVGGREEDAGERGRQVTG